VKHVLTFNVRPSIPDELAGLEKIASNLLWCWDHEAIDLFRRLDEDLWDSSGHNPVLMLNRMSQEAFVRALEDESVMEHLACVKEKFDHYVASENTWFRKFHSAGAALFAYFSAEWGLTECLRIYSGGLGILAGDFFKSASDLGLPIVGVGLLYQEGYFRQYLNMDGWQQEKYETNNFFNLPVKAKEDKDGNPIVISLKLGCRDILVRCWMLEVGRVPLFLLDTNIPENAPQDRRITSQLYGGDLDLRIRQEIVLGIGGVKMLKAIGLDPVVYHMNEGHSAFLALERIRQMMSSEGLPFKEAREVARSGNVFTTHTPVPAGIDEFPCELVTAYLGDYVKDLGMSVDQLLAMGSGDPRQQNQPFNMARFAIREAAYVNGVSRLHGEVSRKMWADMWRGVPFEELPIGYVTNGIHIPSWVSHDMASLLNRYLGSKWIDRPTNEEVWDAVLRIPDAELWRTHERRRERLVAFARKCLKNQLAGRQACSETVERAEEVLDPSTLTIGFARRFAAYKRANLLLQDPQRLKRILTNRECPVQLIFSGKAHPRDSLGKELIRQVIHFARDESVRDHIVFIEDYNMIVSRYLVEGVDIWLNTPLRLMEASGTSGMKVVPNGGLNISVLDGWWDEAFTPDVGWAIGRGEQYTDLESQNRIESDALYDLLEMEVIPLFYSRTRDGLPRGWIRMMKESMRTLCHRFNTDRMVKEYTSGFYLPALRRHAYLTENDFENAKQLASWKAKLISAWKDLRVISAELEVTGQERVGGEITVRAGICLGNLTHEDVTVEAYHGHMGQHGDMAGAAPVEMFPEGSNGDGEYMYKAAVVCEEGGNRGVTIRVIPSTRMVSNSMDLGLITWW
jgi:starch phosphorylase